MKPRIEASTAREAIEKILQENKLSDKINYDILMDFNIGSIKKSTESPANYVDLENRPIIEVQVETCPSPPEKVPLVTNGSILLLYNELCFIYLFKFYLENQD